MSQCIFLSYLWVLLSSLLLPEVLRCEVGQKLSEDCARSCTRKQEKRPYENVHACLSSSCFMVKSVVSSAKSFLSFFPCSLTAGTASHSASVSLRNLCPFLFWVWCVAGCRAVASWRPSSSSYVQSPVDGNKLMFCQYRTRWKILMKGIWPSLLGLSDKFPLLCHHSLIL